MSQASATNIKRYYQSQSSNMRPTAVAGATPGHGATQTSFNKQSQSFYGTKLNERSPRGSNGGISKDHFKNNILMQSQQTSQLVANLAKNDFNSFRQPKHMAGVGGTQNNLLLKQIGGDEGHMTQDKFQINAGSGTLSESVNGQFQYKRDKVSKSTMNQNMPMQSKLHQFQQYQEHNNYQNQKLNMLTAVKKESESQANRTQRSTVVLQKNSIVANNLASTQTHHFGEASNENSSVLTAYQNQRHYNSNFQDIAQSTQEQLIKKQKQLDKLKFTSTRKSQGTTNGQSMSQSKLLQQKYKKFLLDSNPSFANGNQNYGNQQIQVYDKLNAQQVLPPVSFDLTQDSLLQQSMDNHTKRSSNDGPLLSAMQQKSKEKLVSRLEFNDKAFQAMHSSALKETYPTQFIDSSRNHATSQGPQQKPGTSNPFLNSAQQVSLLSTSNNFNQTQQSTYHATTQQTKRNTFQQMAMQQLQKEFEEKELEMQQKFHSKETREERTTAQEIVAINTEFKTYFKSAMQFTDKILEQSGSKSKLITQILTKLQNCQERAMKLNNLQKKNFEVFAQQVEEMKPKEKSEFQKRMSKAIFKKMLNPFGFKDMSQEQKMIGDYQFLKDAQEFLDEAEKDLDENNEENQPKHIEEYPDFSGVTENLELYHDQIMLLSEQEGDIDISKEIKSNQEYFKVFQKGIMSRVGVLQHDSALQLLKRIQKNTTFQEKGIQVDAEDVLETLRKELFDSQHQVQRLKELLSANNQSMDKMQAEQTTLGKKTGELMAQLRKAKEQNQQLTMDKESMQHDLDRYEQKIRDVTHNLQNENKELKQFLHDTEKDFNKFKQQTQAKEVDTKYELEEKQDIIDGLTEDLDRMTKYKLEADEKTEKITSNMEHQITNLQKDLEYSRQMSGKHLNKIKELELKIITLEKKLAASQVRSQVSHTLSEQSVAQDHVDNSHLDVQSHQDKGKISTNKTSAQQRSRSNLSAHSRSKSGSNSSRQSSHKVLPQELSRPSSSQKKKQVPSMTPQKKLVNNNVAKSTKASPRMQSKKGSVSKKEDSQEQAKTMKQQNNAHITSTLVNTMQNDSSKQFEQQTNLHVEITQPDPLQNNTNSNINQTSKTNTQSSQKENLHIISPPNEDHLTVKKDNGPIVLIDDVDSNQVKSVENNKSPDKIEEQLSRLEQDSEASNNHHNKAKMMSQTQMIKKLDMDKISSKQAFNNDQSNDVSPSKQTAGLGNMTNLDDSSDQIIANSVNEQNQRMQSRMKPQLDIIRDSPERSMSIENIVQPGIKVKTSQRQSQNTSMVKESQATQQQKVSSQSKRKGNKKDSSHSRLRKDLDNQSQNPRSSRQKQTRNEQGAQTADEVIQKIGSNQPSQEQNYQNLNYNNNQQVSNQDSRRLKFPVSKNVSSQNVSGGVNIIGVNGPSNMGEYNNQHMAVGQHPNDVRSIQDTLLGVNKSGRHSEASQFQSRMSLNQGHVYNASFKVTKPRYIHEQQNMHIPSQLSICQQHNAGAQTDSFMLFNYFMEFLKVLEEKIKDGIINPSELCEKKPDPFDLKFQEELQKSREKLMQLQEYLSKIRSLKNHGGDIFFNQLANTFMFNPVLPANHQAEKYNREITSRLENLSKLDHHDSQYLHNAVSTSTFIIKNRYSVGGGNYNNVHKGYTTSQQNSHR